MQTKRKTCPRCTNSAQAALIGQGVAGRPLCQVRPLQIWEELRLILSAIGQSLMTEGRPVIAAGVYAAIVVMVIWR